MDLGYVGVKKFTLHIAYLGLGLGLRLGLWLDMTNIENKLWTAPGRRPYKTALVAVYMSSFMEGGDF